MDNSIIENKTSIQTNNFYNTTTFSFTRLLKLCFKTLLIFFYIYEFNLSVWGLPSFVTSRRIVVVVFVAIFIFKFLTKNEKIRIYHDFFHKKVNSLLLILFIFLCYVGFLLLTIGFGEGDTIVPDIIKLILFGVLPLSFLPSVFSSTEEFIKAILLATIAQAIIIILCQFVPTFCNFIDINFSTDYEYVITHRSTYAGGLACITAPGFFRFSMGLFACVYFICKSKKISYFIIYMILSFIGTMIARTGLIIAAIGMLLILFYSLTRGGYSALIKMVISSIIIIVLAVVLLNNPNIQAYLGRTFIRLINLFNNGIKKEFIDGYFGDASGNVFPKLSEKTFFGTGMTYGYSGNGVLCIVDGGYLRLFFAFGLIGVIIFYLFLICSMLKMSRKFKKNNYPLFFSLVFLIFIIFIGEFKEYIVFSQYSLFIFYGIICLSYRKSVEKSGKYKTINAQ